jgi:hypothetical protein
MRAGRFGSKAGRVAVVAAFVLGTLVVGTTAAGAADEALSPDTSSVSVGQVVEAAVSDLSQSDGIDWG